MCFNIHFNDCALNMSSHNCGLVVASIIHSHHTYLPLCKNDKNVKKIKNIDNRIIDKQNYNTD